MLWRLEVKVLYIYRLIQTENVLFIFWYQKLNRSHHVVCVPVHVYARVCTHAHTYTGTHNDVSKTGLINKVTM